MITRGLAINYAMGAAPAPSITVTGSLDDYSIDMNGFTTATIITNATADIVGVSINGKNFTASLVGGFTYLVKIYGYQIGEITNGSIIYYAVKSGAGNESTDSSTITVSGVTYANEFYVLLSDLRTLLNNEFPEIAILIGDRVAVGSMPCIVLEPYDKQIITNITYGKKDYLFNVRLWIYKNCTEEEQGIKILTETAEQLEELLNDNVQYPVGDGSKWYNSNSENTEYGSVNKSGEILQVCKMNWLFKKRKLK